MTRRIRIAICGAVQGAGFRPFIYRLAIEMGLSGWVLNSSRGVIIEAEGIKPQLDTFLLRIEKERPLRSFFQNLEFYFLDPVGFTGFEIRDSDGKGEPTVLVLPDIATCSDCKREIFDPANRRYLYPFTNCTNCGPRFTIIESLPYDRTNTTMRKFEMCGECRREYENPGDRRFHAQINACPSCGPHLELWDERGKLLTSRHDALIETARAIRAGQIVAVKGLGGFHLVVDARNEDAIIRLRQRKHREEKPFALMFPSYESVREYCAVDALEERLLHSPESPIVLLRRQMPVPPRFTIAPSTAPRNPYLGIMLPYSPLHDVLMMQLGFPVVATSGNLSNEPICTDEVEAVERLQGIADLFLVHNRPISRHADDSIVRVMAGRESMLRRARGYAPLPVRLKEPASPAGGPAPSILAVGGHLKNTVAITVGSNVFMSQHIGDLESPEAFAAFRKAVVSLQTLYHARPERIACDMHPDYLSTQFAKEQALPIVMVQHHHAHVASCMAENELEGRVLGVSWDGTGYGSDGTIWGGEFLLTDGVSCRRIASFRRFKLPGNACAVKEPRRTAIGLLHEIFGDAVFERDDLEPLKSFAMSERALLRQMLSKGLNSPLTSSAGRLFDAVASIAGLRQRINFEGQAAMELEFAIEDKRTDEVYPFQVREEPVSIHGSPVPHDLPLKIWDWEPMIRRILADLKCSLPIGVLSAKFHNTLVEAILEFARWIGEERVVLSGGCFQNRYLIERAVHRLEAEGFRPYWHRRIPPNDGGIALGQVLVALEATKRTAIINETFDEKVNR